MALTVGALFVHPVKSCGGIAVDAVEVDARGFADDRRWMVVDPDGRFVTQRERPEMARVRVALEAGGYRLLCDGSEFLLPRSAADRAPRRSVVIWNDTVEAAVDEAGSRWMAKALGGPCQLVHLPSDVRRAVGKRGAPDDQVSFADGFSALVVGRASVEDLAARAGIAVDLRRFRPNLVVDGSPPWDEDRWRTLSAGEVRFRALKPCDRCSIPGLDPDTGERSKEPLATLATFRKKDGAVWLGVNLAHDGPGRICVGDTIHVEERGPALFD
jgi:uncharacterized protein YcbX